MSGQIKFQAHTHANTHTHMYAMYCMVFGGIPEQGSVTTHLQIHVGAVQRPELLSI